MIKKDTQDNQDIGNAPQPLVLYSDGLLSKWGFSDGDVLGNYTYDTWDIYDFQFQEHKALEELIKRYLLPKLNKKVEVIFIGTIHNPLRAEMIDGEYYRNWYDDDDVQLLPESVEITPEQVMAVLKDFGYTQKSDHTPEASTSNNGLGGHK